MRPPVAAFALALAVAAASCGKAGAPKPPAPRGPLPAGGVVARQIGADVEIAFTVPAPRGEAPSQAPVLAEILRVPFAPGLQPSPDPVLFRVRGEVIARVEGDPLDSGARRFVRDPVLSELEGGASGWTLRYAVRVRDRRGRPSALVAAADLRFEAVDSAPTDLAAEPTAEGIRLEWADATQEGRYNVYRAVGDGAYDEAPVHLQPVTGTRYLDAAVVPGTAYRYRVRRVLADGVPRRESAATAEVRVAAEDRFPPAAPTGLVAVQEGAAVRLFWNPGAERDLRGYRVFARTNGGEWRRVGPDPVLEPSLLDREVRVGERIAYRVTAVDRTTPPNESAPSEIVEVGIVDDPLHPGRMP
ncbi:MAG TPA: hypothetical protein VF139_03925 [Candidatus Polarisedimenticolaceae bacterium]